MKEVEEDVNYSDQDPMEFNDFQMNDDINLPIILSNQSHLYDPAEKFRGKLWFTPPVWEYENLINECKWEYIDKYGVVGWKVTGTNGNYIFFPLKKRMIVSPTLENVYFSVLDMFLLTSTPEVEGETISTQVGKTKNAYFVKLDKHSPQIIKKYRVYSGFVRPVAIRPKKFVHCIDESTIM